MPSYPSQRAGRASPDRSVEFPEPIRAAAGLAATVLDRARHLPATITGLPVRVAGMAMQASLRLQQEYAGLVVRGDELLVQFGGDDAEPAWATFDDDVVDVADAVTEHVGVDVTAADDVALPPLPGTTRPKAPRANASAARMGHAPSAFDLAEDLPSVPSSAPETPITTPGKPVPGGPVPGAPVSSEPVPGYDGFTLAQLRARLRTFDAATLHALLNHERVQRARAPYVTMLENRLSRSHEKG